MSLMTLKIIAASSIFLVAVIGGIIAIKLAHVSQRIFRICDAFASGIFIGVACFHLIPDSYSLFKQLNIPAKILIILILVILGLIFLIALEKIIKKFGVQANGNYVQLSSLLLVFLFCIHALIEGTTLGIDPAVTTTLMIFIAIIAHKGTASFAISTNLICAKFSRVTFLSLAVLFCVMTPIGIILGTQLLILFSHNDANWFTAIFNAIAAGNLIYIGLFHSTKINFWHPTKQEPIVSLFLGIGIILMALVSIWI